LFAAVAPTDLEQYLVELVNRARANPAAEAARYGIDLNEGLAPGTISAAPRAPLAVNPFLTDSARGHSRWMVDTDTFSHTGAGGSSSMARMRAAGYAFDPTSFAAGENIAWRGTKPGVPDPLATTARLHQDLFVDANYPGRGHRVNLLSPNYREIGAGVATGDFTGYNAVAVTEDFAASGTGSFLTGVAFTDAVLGDNFYTPGEGLGGVTVTAVRAGDGATFSTPTYASGGYSLRLTPGTYHVSATGAGLGGTVRLGDVAVGSQNVKRDVRPVPPGATAVVGRSVFYNNSAYDGHDPAATIADLNAVAPDKVALRPGQVGSFANVTSYTRGINGILVDFAGIPPAGATLGADDFTFRMGRGGDPASWAAAPAPAAVVLLATPTASNAARYALTWPDDAITNQWLQVTVKANPHTGLASPDVFYFGNLIAEAGDAGAPLRISSLDLAATRARLNSAATRADRVDFDRDGRVTALDIVAIRRNLFRELNPLLATS
jgi:uncharacterized protein YkwD